jgi:putative ABC transport system permease protein
VSALRQFFGLLAIGLSGLLRRLGPVLTILVGVACAVGVLVSMLAMGAGARRQEMSDVRDDRVILTGLGQRPQFGSIPREQAAAIEDMPQIRRDKAGRPIVVLESVVPMAGRRRGSAAITLFPVFGVTSNITEYEPEMRLTSGRMFHPGMHELVTSNTCTRLFSGLDIGDRPSIHRMPWRVVGHFDLGHANDCVVYADVGTVMSVFANSTYSGLEVMLRSPSDFDAFRAAIKANPALQLDAELQRTVVADDFKQLNAVLDFASYFVGTIMAIGGMLGAVNSLYAIVDSRRRELATLRAFGFRPSTLVASALCESMLLAVPGALLGVALAWLFFSGISASPFGYTFQLDVTPALALLGVVWALVMGLIAGILPAVRAARLAVTTALRAT